MPARKAKQAASIEIFSDGGPEAMSVLLLLEELHIAYKRSGPVMTLDHDGPPPLLLDPAGPNGHALSLSDASAALLYLARKFGRFHSRAGRRRIDVEECLFSQGKGVAMIVRQILLLAEEPGFGSASGVLPHDHHNSSAGGVCGCLLEVLNRQYRMVEARLASRPYLADSYSIADMALWPWLRPSYRFGLALEDAFPRLADWYESIEHRPAVQRVVNRQAE